MNSSKKYLLALLFLYVAFRFLILLSYSETISYELYRGTLAKEFMEGPRLPWGDYLTDPYSSAPIFNAFLTAPFFFVFGSNLFALKFVPFCWHLLSLVTWYFVFRSFFSSRQTFIILLFFIFAPPRIIEYSLANHGTHFELILWTALSLLVFNRMFLGKISVVRGAFILGLFGGFSTSLVPSNFITVAVLLFYFALAGGRKIFYPIYGMGFLIGFSPWIYYNFHHAWSGFTLLEAKLGGVFSFDGFLNHIRFIFFSRDSGLSGLLSFEVGIYILSLCILIVRKWGFWKDLRGRFDVEGFAIFYQIFLIGLLTLVQFGWADYYFFPLFPFVGMTIVSAFQNAKLILKQAVFGFCIFAGLIGNFGLIDFKEMGKTLSIQGYSYGEAGEILQKKAKLFLNGRSLNDKLAFYQTFDDEVFVMKGKEDLQRAIKFIQEVEEEIQPILFEKLGRQLGVFSNFDSTALLNILERYSIHPQYYPGVFQGAVLGLNRTDSKGLELGQKGLSFCNGIASQVKPVCYEGLGALADPEYLPSKIKNHPKIAEQIAISYHPSYFQGLGRYFFTEWVNRSNKVKPFVDSLNPEERKWLYEGFRKEISILEDPWTRQTLLKKLGS